MAWPIEKDILEAQKNKSDSGTSPPGKMYVPTSMAGKVLDWVHTAKFACHPGIRCVLHLIKVTFWWPNLNKDVKDFVSACPTCAQNKHSNHPPAGLLLPLPIPS